MDPRVQWSQTHVADMGGQPVDVMVCEHGESYTWPEWQALPQSDRDSAKDRHDRFHRRGKYASGIHRH